MHKPLPGHLFVDPMLQHNLGLLAAFLLVLIGAPAAAVTHDAEWVFGSAGSDAYVLDSFAPAESALGTLEERNPVVNLRFGLRYEVTVPSYGMHPLEILAKGASVGEDTVLLSTQPGVTGTLEGEASVGWTDDGAGTIGFTVSRRLASAMQTGGATPGYRCRAHPFTMRGDFMVIGAPLADPLPQPIAKGSVRVELALLAAGLTAPLDLRTAPDGSERLFVTDQAGTVRLVQAGALLATPFLDVRDRLVAPLGILGSHDETDYDERGLLGFAIHPDFANPAAHGFRKVYTYTSEPVTGLADFTTPPLTPGVRFDHQNVVAEWTVDPTDANRVGPASRREVLRVDHPQFNHNGGMMAFDQERYLLIGIGDGGAGNDVGEGHGQAGNGQNLDTLLGSLIRIDPLPSGASDASDPISPNGQYRIPASNPFVHVDGLDEIYAYGWRNPYRFCLDTLTGRLVVADVGQDHVEEIDIVAAGANAGWHLKEGTFRFNPADASVTNDQTGLPAGLLDPVAEYDHDEGSAIVGGFVYRGSALPELSGRYVFGDFSRGFTQPGGRLFSADLETGRIEELIIGLDDRALGLYLKGFGVDDTGELYVLGSTALGPYGTSGVVLRLAAPAAPPVQHTLTYLAGSNGTILDQTTQTVNHGDSGSAVTAKPATGHHFVQWSDGSTANPRTDTNVTADLTVTAQFAINTYTLTYLAGANGTILEPATQTVNHGYSGSAVTAKSATGHHFAQWSDGSTANPRTDANVTADLTVTAQFAITVYTVVFHAGSGGSLIGTNPQTVPYGGSTTPVDAVADYGYVFVHWDDGSTAKLRTATAVETDMTLTASFRPAEPVAANGSFLVIEDAAAVSAGRGLWDVSGTYVLSVAGNPLLLTMTHDGRGRLTGTASYGTAKAATVTMPIKASVNGRNGSLAVKIRLKGADAAKTTAVSLLIALTLDAPNRQLVGPVAGNVMIGETRSPVSTTARLPLPAPMDGTWKLRFQFTPSGSAVTGTALLTLSNGAAYLLTGRGKTAGQAVALRLSADQSDPTAKGIEGNTTVTPRQGEWATLETALLKAFGQTLGW